MVLFDRPYTTFCWSAIVAIVYLVPFSSYLTLKVKVKVWTLVIALLTRVRLVTSSDLHYRKWQLIGISQMVPQRIMWPSIARANEQLDHRCS